MRPDRGDDNQLTPSGGSRPPLKGRDIVALILAAYKTSLPYFLLIVLVLIVITWLLTEVIFVS